VSAKRQCLRYGSDQAWDDLNLRAVKAISGFDYLPSSAPNGGLIRRRWALMIPSTCTISDILGMSHCSPLLTYQVLYILTFYGPNCQAHAGLSVRPTRSRLKPHPNAAQDTFWLMARKYQKFVLRPVEDYYFWPGRQEICLRTDAPHQSISLKHSDDPQVPSLIKRFTAVQRPPIGCSSLLSFSTLLVLVLVYWLSRGREPP